MADGEDRRTEEESATWQMLTEQRTGVIAQAWGSGGERGAFQGDGVSVGSPKPGGSWSSDTGMGGAGRASRREQHVCGLGPSCCKGKERSLRFGV